MSARPSIRRAAVWSQGAAGTLVTLQILAILVLGGVTVARFHIFAPVDERAHLAYVAEVAAHGRLPFLGHAYVPWQELAIEAHTYPRRSSLNPQLIGLRGVDYEAWQPPLYYVLAAPVFLIPSNYRDKVLAVRAFDLLLVMAAVAALAALARAVFWERWLVPYALALSTFMWPGVLVRLITVSNAALGPLVVALFLLAAWRATVDLRGRTLIAAAGLLGLCALTQLVLLSLAPLLAFPIVARLRTRHDRNRAITVTGLALALPVALISPWLASNESRYGALTANSLVERLTGSYESAVDHSGLEAVTTRLWRLAHAALPLEWYPEYRGVIGVLMLALPLALVMIAAMAVARRPRLLRSRVAGLLGSPLLLGVATLIAIVLLQEWPAALFPRYVYPMLAPFALFSAWAWLNSGFGRRWLAAFVVAASLVASVGWVYMAGAYYFTHVGASLGIHAAPPG